jgi:hypothetical protein
MKKRILGTFSAFLFVSLVLTGCSLFGAKDLDDKDDQKDFLEDAVNAFKDEDAVELSGKNEDEDEELTMKIKGDDLSMEGTMGGEEMKVRVIGDKMYSYYGSEWYEMDNDGSADEMNYKDEFEDELDFDDDDWDDEVIKYEGIEEVDGEDTYKFKIKSKDEGDEDGVAYFYFSVKDKLPVKMEVKEGEDKGLVLTFKYDDVKIEKPEGAKSMEDMMNDMNFGDIDVDMEDM